MSGAVTSLPPEIRELMTTTVSWEQALGPDGYGQQSYALAITLSCWTEERGTAGGFEANRGSVEWVWTPQISLYFDGSDPNVQLFDLQDRFTILGIGGTPAGMTLQPQTIAPFYGPNFDNRDPWLIAVVLEK